MKQKMILMFMIIFLISYSAYAIDNAAKKKYPYSILTKDYGILNERDLNDDLEPEPFSLEKPPNDISGHVYWQCFPRDRVSTTLEDAGSSGYSSFSPEKGDDNDGYLTITVYSKPGILHKYEMRRHWPLTGTKQRFDRFIKIMRGEKYVCLAGSFFLRETRTRHEQKQQVYFWTFEKLKTKKGCDSYFEPVNCS